MSAHSTRTGLSLAKMSRDIEPSLIIILLVFFLSTASDFRRFAGEEVAIVPTPGRKLLVARRCCRLLLTQLRALPRFCDTALVVCFCGAYGKISSVGRDRSMVGLFVALA